MSPYKNLRHACIPYLRLMRLQHPKPILLLIWPLFWALWIAAQTVPQIHLIAIFVCGAILMRSFGCIVNDISDRSFDKQVSRTKSRPLASDQISIRSALILALILLMSAASLLIFLNQPTLWMALGAVILAVLYPLTKRWTYFPQVILGLAFNWGILMAFSATLGTINIIAIWLFAIAVIWTVAYDTIYALADYEDDLKVGIKSTAVFFGPKAPFAILALEGIMCCMLIMMGIYLHYDFVFYTAMVFIVGVMLHQFSKLNRQHKQPIQLFSAHHWVGLIIWLGIAWQYTH